MRKIQKTLFLILLPVFFIFSFLKFFTIVTSYKDDPTKILFFADNLVSLHGFTPCKGYYIIVDNYYKNYNSRAIEISEDEENPLGCLYVLAVGYGWFTSCILLFFDVIFFCFFYKNKSENYKKRNI